MKAPKYPTEQNCYLLNCAIAVKKVNNNGLFTPPKKCHQSNLFEAKHFANRQQEDQNGEKNASGILEDGKR